MKCFGDKKSFGLQVAPLAPGWRVAERGPWAALSIWSGGKNLAECVAEGTGEHFEALEVPLLPLAEWLLASAPAIAHEEYPSAFGDASILHEALARWDLSPCPQGMDPDEEDDARHAWYSRHFITAGADGALLPDIALARVDERLFVSWRQPRIAGPRQLRFLVPQGLEHHSWEPAWGALDAFVRWVLEASGECVVPATPLRDAASMDVAEYLRLVVPPALPLLDDLQGQSPATSPSLRALRDLEISQPALASIRAALALLSERPPDAGARSRLAKLREGFAPSAMAADPERAGYEGAIALRHELALNGEPVSTEALESFLASVAAVDQVDSGSTANSSALGIHPTGEAGAVFVNHARTRRPWARRMELSRAICHLLMDGRAAGEALGAGSSVAARGPRRRRSGAFAAQLLLPAEGARRLLAGRPPTDPDVFGELLEVYQVGAQAAAHHLWNQGFLRSQEERDLLIEEFTRQPGQGP